MKKPIIGITSNEKIVSENVPIIHLSVSRNFADGIKRAGGIPFYIPLSDEEYLPDYVSTIDKLLLTGGQNVLPKFYGQEQVIASDDYFRERDEFELNLIREALKQGKPIFGVCRGLQLFNVARGGTIKQSIEGHRFSPFELAHKVLFEPESPLEKIFGPIAEVNSVHSQSLDKLGQGLEVIGRSKGDGIIEAVRSTDDSRFLGVQWHPEFLIDNNGGHQGLFDYFVRTL